MEAAYVLMKPCQATVMTTDSTGTNFTAALVKPGS